MADIATFRLFEGDDPTLVVEFVPGFQRFLLLQVGMGSYFAQRVRDPTPEPFPFTRSLDPAITGLQDGRTVLAVVGVDEDGVRQREVTTLFLDLEAPQNNRYGRGSFRDDFMMTGPVRDVLVGRRGDDLLIGGGTDDETERLSGGRGEDTLVGGAGTTRYIDVVGKLRDGVSDGERDIFVLAAPEVGVARITTFVSGEDVLRLDWTGAADLIVGDDPTPVGTGPTLLYDQAGRGALAFDPDGVGAAAAVVFAVLGFRAQARPDLAISDFVFGG